MEEVKPSFLIHDVARQIRYRFDGLVRSLGVTRPQWRLLLTLSRYPGESQAVLADILEVERITLCRMIDRLEEAGFLERRADLTDRRVWRIFLTAKGGKIVEKLQAIADKFNEELFSTLSAEDEEKLKEMLLKLREALSKRNETMSTAV